MWEKIHGTCLFVCVSHTHTFCPEAKNSARSKHSVEAKSASKAITHRMSVSVSIRERKSVCCERDRERQREYFHVCIRKILEQATAMAQYNGPNFDRYVFLRNIVMLSDTIHIQPILKCVVCLHQWPTYKCVVAINLSSMCSILELAVIGIHAVHSRCTTHTIKHMALERERRREWRSSVSIQTAEFNIWLNSVYILCEMANVNRCTL